MGKMSYLSAGLTSIAWLPIMWLWSLWNKMFVGQQAYVYMCVILSIMRSGASITALSYWIITSNHPIYSAQLEQIVFTVTVLLCDYSARIESCGTTSTFLSPNHTPGDRGILSYLLLPIVYLGFGVISTTTQILYPNSLVVSDNIVYSTCEWIVLISTYIILVIRISDDWPAPHCLQILFSIFVMTLGAWNLSLGISIYFIVRDTSYALRGLTDNNSN